MTSNQINNRAQHETVRNNKAVVRETKRHNIRGEDISQGTLDETKRNNRYNNALGTTNAVMNGIKTVADIGTGVAKIVNDPSWYNLNKQLVHDVSSFAFGAPLGSPTPIFKSNGSKAGIPGVMRIQYTLAYGDASFDEGSSLNMASKQIYSYVRYANSGARNYDAPDLMLYLLAMDSLYSLIAEGKRAYSLALTAKGENRYYSNAMLTAAGWDPENVRENLAQLRAAVNQICMRTNALYVPDVMPLVLRHTWLNINIFKDAPIKKSNEYVFVPTGYFMHDDVHGCNIFVARTTPTGTNMTVSDYITLCNRLLNALLTSEDIGLMSGDILKAYGNTHLVTMMQIADDFHIESAFSNEVLTQINGASICGTLVPSYSQTSGSETGTKVYGIFQNEDGQLSAGYALMPEDPSAPKAQVFGTLLASGYNVGSQISSYLEYSNSAKFINMYKDDVTDDDAMVATRLMIADLHIPGTISGVNWGDMVATNHTGTEIVNSVQIFYYSVTSSSDPTYALKSNSLSSQVFPGFSWAMALYFTFDWAPIIYYSNSSSNTDQAIPLTDIQNYSHISSSNLYAMHQVATLSEFGVPLLGTKVRL